MKKIVCCGVLTAAMLLFCGCFVQSLNPLFSEKELVSYPDLAGTWKMDNQTWTFVPDDKAYTLTHVDEKNHAALFHASVGKLGTNYFMDLYLKDPKFDDVVNQLALAHLIPAHVMVKMTKREGNLILTAMDPKWFEKAIKQNPKLLSHVIQEDRPIITASTEELQQFVSKYANDTNVFTAELELKQGK